ncbi:hypothetical protein [Aeromicrobium piscarium]|uniref:ATP synthase protein I n=1 Tax=Aeromicrobium piscarium TaxID=2590901 RepID=A0A554SGW8_9ACTN|nr:hypothetical protein [Aeromicrobium piscarium]TSD65588.1 hypothetical protein FNM00_03965 [Aeromicrobium piscarium]
MEVRQPRRFTGAAAFIAIVVCAAVAAAEYGASGAGSAAVGGALVIVFFGSTKAFLGPIVAVLPHASLATAMLFYFTKVVALLAFFVVVDRFAEPAGPLHRAAVAGTVIVVTLVWMAVSTVDATRARIPMFDLPDDEDKGPDSLGTSK